MKSENEMVHTLSALSEPEVKFACGVTQVMTPETWSVLEADSVVAERKQVCATVCVSRLHARLCQLRHSCLRTKTP